MRRSPPDGVASVQGAARDVSLPAPGAAHILSSRAERYSCRRIDITRPALYPLRAQTVMR